MANISQILDKKVQNVCAHYQGVLTNSFRCAIMMYTIRRLWIIYIHFFNKKEGGYNG